MNNERVQKRAESSAERDEPQHGDEGPEINDLEADNEVEQDMIETVDPENAPA